MSLESQAQLLVNANTPNTDILPSHKLCDLVDKILPSAFGTTTLKQKGQKQTNKNHQVLKSKPSLRAVGRAWTECRVDAKPRSQSRYTFHSAVPGLPGRVLEMSWKLLCLLLVPLPATKKSLRIELRSEASERTGLVPIIWSPPRVARTLLGTVPTWLSQMQILA